jgi:hypothetical protein
MLSATPTSNKWEPASDPPDPEDMPGDPRDQRLALAYWRRRGVKPPWSSRVDADLLVTRGELRAVFAALRRRGVT